MNKYSALPIALSVLFLSVSVALAQDVTISSTTAVGNNPNAKNTKELRNQMRQTATTERKEARAQIKEQMKEQRMLFKEKLAEIKDARKQAALTRIDTRLAAVNARRTTHMETALARMQNILTVITQKAESASASGADTTTLDQAIATATTALKTAQDAVAAQKEKEYVLSITSETTLRQTVGPVVSGMQEDLRTTRTTAVAAKQAVKQAATELAKLSPTPSVSPADTSLTPTATEEATEE